MWATMPSGPRQTASASAGPGRQVATTSHVAASAAGEADQAAPASSSAVAAARRTSCTMRPWPASNNCPAIGAPILPTPMNPIFMSCPGFCCETGDAPCALRDGRFATAFAAPTGRVSKDAGPTCRSKRCHHKTQKNLAGTPHPDANPRGCCDPMCWFVNLIAVLLLGLFIAPMLVKVCLPDPRGGVPWYEARRDSSGLAPDPAATQEAVILVFAAPAVSWRGLFAVHSWIAIKPSGAPRYTRYEVVGFG